MDRYRDPDDMPVDPDALDEPELAPARHAATSLIIDPDALRPALLAGEEESFIDDDLSGQ
jgi:hypothetical protein